MKAPLVHLADAEYGVEENMFELFRTMTTLPDGELVESEKLSYHHTFILNPMFNGVWGTNLSEDEVDAAIEQTLDWFKARKVPYIFWWTGTRTQPVNLPERLVAHGFALNFPGDPGMIATLHALPEHVNTPDGFTVKVVTNEEMLEDWRDVFCASFEAPLFAGQAWIDAAKRVGISNTPWQLYVGYLHDQPVATNILFNGAGIAGLYGVGTIAEARGKGIGAAITWQPLVDARAQGYHIGALFASEMGYPVYKRLGFQDTACRIGRYMWRSE